MNNNHEEATFNVAPVDTTEANAALLLMDDSRASEFWDGLNQAADGSWTVTFLRGQTDYVLREPDLERLAAAFVSFDPDKFRQQQESMRKQESEQRAAEQAAQGRRKILNNLFGGV